MNLNPVRDALMDDARRRAAELRAAADEEATATVAAARREADRMLAAARDEGEAEARRVAAIEGARARRQARERVLAARRAAYDGLRADARRAARELRHDPRYPGLVEGVARLARRQLGQDAVVRVDEEAGGVVATAGSRSVDYRLDALADRGMNAMGAGVEALWR